MDRLTYQNEKIKDGRELVDEVVLSNANVHLEALDDRTYMLIVENDQKHIHLQIFPQNPRSKIAVVVYEEEDK